MKQLKVTEFPADALGLRYTFTVKVFTQYSTDGIESAASESLILAGLPDKPSAAPSRSLLTSETVVAVNIV